MNNYAGFDDQAVLLAQEFFTAFGANETPKLKDLVSKDCQIITERGGDQVPHPIYGTFNGVHGAELFFSNLKRTFDTQKFEIPDVFGDANRACAHGTFSHQVVRTGYIFDSDWCAVFKIQHGNISFYQFYEDTAALEQAFEVVRNDG